MFRKVTAWYVLAVWKLIWVFIGLTQCHFNPLFGSGESSCIVRSESLITLDLRTLLQYHVLNSELLFPKVRVMLYVEFLTVNKYFSASTRRLK